MNIEVSRRQLFVGAGACVVGTTLGAGERPHIGAIAAAQPRPSLRDPTRTSATASVLTFLGHKEDGIVKMASERLTVALDTHVVVTAGIHLYAQSGCAGCHGDNLRGGLCGSICADPKG